MNLTIGITGASGYVGSRLCETLESVGHTLVRLVRQPAAGDRRFNLGDPTSPETLQGIDVLIHCAWDMRASQPADVRRINIEGSRQLFAAARSAGVQRIVFISSMSAYTGCRSVYGQAKLEVEHMLETPGGVSIRPGLIYGNDPGGMVGALLALATRTPVLPMIGSGNYTLHTCHEDDLSSLLSLVCTARKDNTPDLITAAEETGRRFRDIVATLADRELWFIPVPWRLAWFGLRSLEALGLRPRMKSDSIIGLVYSDPAPDFASLKQLGMTFRALETPTGAACRT